MQFFALNLVPRSFTGKFVWNTLYTDQSSMIPWKKGITHVHIRLSFTKESRVRVAPGADLVTKHQKQCDQTTDVTRVRKETSKSGERVWNKHQFYYTTFIQITSNQHEHKKRNHNFIWDDYDNSFEMITIIITLLQHWSEKWQIIMLLLCH
jgi:hypothetical protein